MLNTVNSEIFARILFSRIALKGHIWDIRNSRLGHDIPISVNDRVILPFHEGFNFTEIKTLAEIKPLRIFFSECAVYGLYLCPPVA